jgi:uncharacterized protein (DUF4415 family)
VSKRRRAGWAKLQKMTDQGIDYSDIPPTDAKFWEKAQVVLPPVKTHLSLRLDEDVVEWFKRQGAGYQTKINAVLRSYVQAHSVKGKTWVTPHSWLATGGNPMAVTYKNGEILSTSFLGHMEIHRLVTQRARKKGKKLITLETLLKEQHPPV